MMKTLLVFALLCVFGASVWWLVRERPVEAKEYVVLSQTKEELNEKQKEQLASIKGLETTVSSIVVRFNPDCVGKMPLKIWLNENTKLVIDKYEQKNHENGCKSITWKEGKEIAVLSFSGQYVVGLVYTDNKVFAIEPLGDGLAAISQIDQTKFPKD
jgi:hypothetical protein